MIKKLVKNCYKEITEPYFIGMPAQLAFYLFLSITPTMVLASQLFGLFDLTLEEIEIWMNIDINSEAAQALSMLLDSKPAGTNSIMLALVAVWGASKALFSISKISNRINTNCQTAGRVYLKDRIIAIGFMIILLITIVSAIVFLVYVPAVIDLALRGNIIGTLLSKIWVKLRWFVVISLFCFTIMYVYCTAPKIRPKPKEVAPGAIFASLGMLLMTGLFNIYVKTSISRSVIYGSLSSIVALLMWFWFVSWVICLGAIFNKGWFEAKTDKVMCPKNDNQDNRNNSSIISVDFQEENK